MTKKITVINTDKISQTVCELCIQANISITKDVYSELVYAYENETSEKSKVALQQILENARLAKESRRPICQDTGAVIVFIEIGQNVFLEGMLLEKAINIGVEKAYKDNFLRKSIVNDPLFERINTGTNTPAVIYTQIVEGSSIKISVAAKGFGSENVSAVRLLKPADGVEGVIDFIVNTVKDAGSRPCPPVRIGIGIGGTLEYAALLAKKSLLLPVKSKPDMIELSKHDKIAALEYEIYRKVNELGIGASGLHGDNSAYGVNILTYPTHIASLPVAVNINCHASRHASAIIFEDKIVYENERFQEQFLKLDAVNSGIKINSEDINAIRQLKAGENILLNGYIYTARDAAHKKLYESVKNSEELSIDIKDKIIFYVGPCPSNGIEPIGPAGPTTSARMDKYTPELLKLGLLATIGKGERAEAVIEAMKLYKGVYFVATGGAAVLLSKKIKEAEIVAYPELGAEAIYKFKVEDFPLIVAIDSSGENIFS